MKPTTAPRVVVASRVFVPDVAAAAFRLRALVNGLDSRGARVQVLTTTPPRALPVPAVPARVRRWPVLRDRGGNVRGYVQYLSYDIPAFFRLLVTDADVVVSEPPPTTGAVVALTSWLRHRPYVYYAADVWSDALAAMTVPAPVIGIMRAVEGRVLRHAAMVIAVSDVVGEQVGAFGVPPERVAVVGNGVDTDVFRPTASPAVSGSDPYVVYTGTMSEWQGADVFVKAMAIVARRHPRAQLRFFGQGTDEVHLRELAARLCPQNVVFGGVVPPAEAAAWISGARAALVSIKPDQGYDFAKPTKIYAAAACGTPVIFAGKGAGAAVVADNELGDAVDHTPDAVAAAIEERLTASSSPAQREHRMAWVRENASLAASGELAADMVLAVLR
ncbi:glycosyltransferase WbuB [Tersicoccus phoenicis]|uniref:Glycosyltransferase WbuB n=1 Tax=Tersicoccus phoenicis TaxID=554083 RepID=A0A1R1LHS9_9MICC|nr:glycosyltransferase family 4 protein [Tersicoccus phoenicis]OMH27062.1 glycosyltransferase WbuB [Tersicoccus phoenicis]